MVASGTANVLANLLCFMLLRGRVRLQWGFWGKIALLAGGLSMCVQRIITTMPLLTLGLRFFLFCLLMVTGVYLFRILSRDDTARFSGVLHGLITGGSGEEEGRG